MNGIEEKKNCPKPVLKCGFYTFGISGPDYGILNLQVLGL
jgi:hypothetical protein